MSRWGVRFFLPLALFGFITPVVISTANPLPAYAIRCDCSVDSECGSGRTCDTGSSAGCDVYQGKDGLCISDSGAGGGSGEPIDLTVPIEIPTPLGNIPVDPARLAGWVLNFGIGLGTLLSVLFIVIGGYGVATSGGNPENLEQAKQRITSAIAGLLFILLTTLILNTIGGIIGIGTFPFQ